MIRVHVEGGTGAGVREPYRGNPASWLCQCKFFGGDCDPRTCTHEGVRKFNPGYLARCPDCGEKRP